MRISDWSSDVCSSDLRVGKRGFHLAQRSKQDDPPAGGAHLLEGLGGTAHAFAGELRHAWLVQGIDRNTGNSGPADQSDLLKDFETGRASCRERVVKHV